jgi:hypothetical protein
MSQLDFDYGWNTEPMQQDDNCIGMLVCPHCGKAVICQDVPSNRIIQTEGNENMDLSKHASGKAKQKFEQRDWIDSQEHLPAKGSRKFKVDGFRASKDQKKAKGAVGYVDLSSGKIKVVMSLRPGFTLDAFIEELGGETDKWIGKQIALERGGSEGQYVNVAG